MSIFVGAYDLSDSNSLSSTLCGEMLDLASRNKKNNVATFEWPNCFLIKVDCGAYGVSGVCHDESGSISLLAGELVLDSDEPNFSLTADRQEELCIAHNRFCRADWSILEHARGTFCGAFFDSSKRSLRLFTDKLGIRPLYYRTSADLVVFSTAIRILEGINSLPLSLDPRGATEATVFGYPLAERTPYKQIAAAGPGQVVIFRSGAAVQKRYYFRLDMLPTRKEPREVLAKRLHTEFLKAARLRLRGDKHVVALLSGGLDSRCVVTALHELGMGIHTYNLSWQHSADELLGREFAHKIGTFHRESRMPPGKTGLAWPRMTSEAIEKTAFADPHRPERPGTVWGGDGGSVVAGHVYVNDRMTELLRAGDREGAVSEFINEQSAYAAKAILASEFVEAATEFPRLGIHEELETLQCDDPGRLLYHFLVRNDQRRHLAAHFENIDQTRIEFHLPFFDSEVASAFSSVPIDLSVGHRFYMNWFAEFPDLIQSVPWQVYSGHERCPIPLPNHVQSQWERNKTREAVVRRQRIRAAGVVLRETRFPHELLDKRRLRAAQWLLGLRLRDCGYLIEAASEYNRYWQICEARINSE